MTTARFAPGDYRKFPLLGLATSLQQERDYEAEVEGTIPAELQGTLYRNGPGLFERQGIRKRCLLDGDGLVQAFHLRNGSAHYVNRFVRTEKYMRESRAGKYLYATWSTRAPGGMWSNLGGGNIGNQAGVTVLSRDGRLFAFDEFQVPYELNPQTLETLGPTRLGLPRDKAFFSAHSKIDRLTGDWFFFRIEHGRRPTLHLIIIDRHGQLRKYQSYPLSSQVYMHDFFVSQRHVIFHLHPVEISPWGYLMGLNSLIDAMEWQPENGSEVLVFDRFEDTTPLRLETEPRWMWHSLNAYESKGEIVADFVGYRHPDHFLDKDPALFAIMDGRQGSYEYPGEFCRFRIDLRGKVISQELLASGNFEFPTLNPEHSCHRHRFGYVAAIVKDRPFFTAVSRVDTINGRTETFDFGPAMYCSEPIFASKPGFLNRFGARVEPGWLLTEVYDGKKHKSFLAILDAERLGQGPIARIHLDHHVPIGFHGFWQAAST